MKEFFPLNLNMPLFSPLLKKQSLPKDDLSSYRPISNLNFISKVLERVIYSRLCNHLGTFPSLSSFQSAYRKFYSTETALMRIHNDLTLAMDKQLKFLLLFFWISQLHSTQLTTTFFLAGLTPALESLILLILLLSSYLSQRSQAVAIDQTFSPTLPLIRGVPQGSVLGPLLFTLYTTPLSHLLTDSSLQFHFYADDTQIYISFSGTESNSALAKPTLCS